MTRWPIDVMTMAAVAVAALGACVAPSTQRCEGELCPGDRACVAGVGCVDPTQLAACADHRPFDACTIAGIPDGVCVALPPSDVLGCAASGCGGVERVVVHSDQPGDERVSAAVEHHGPRREGHTRRRPH